MARSVRIALTTLLLAPVALVAPTALALQQPGGPTIPIIDGSVNNCSDKNIQVCLDQEEGGNTINAVSAAAVTPETFNPTCGSDLQSHRSRRRAINNTFGWYNVNPGGKPPDSDLHAFSAMRTMRPAPPRL